MFQTKELKAAVEKDMQKLIKVEPEAHSPDDRLAKCYTAIKNLRSAKFVTRDELLDACAAHLTSGAEFNRVLETLQIKVAFVFCFTLYMYMYIEDSINIVFIHSVKSCEWRTPARRSSSLTWSGFRAC